jgi:hypothetical protein
MNGKLVPAETLCRLADAIGKLFYDKGFGNDVLTAFFESLFSELGAPLNY